MRNFFFLCLLFVCICYCVQSFECDWFSRMKPKSHRRRRSFRCHKTSASVARVVSSFVFASFDCLQTYKVSLNSITSVQQQSLWFSVNVVDTQARRSCSFRQQANSADGVMEVKFGWLWTSRTGAARAARRRLSSRDLRVIEITKRYFRENKSHETTSKKQTVKTKMKSKWAACQGKTNQRSVKKYQLIWKICDLFWKRKHLHVAIFCWMRIIFVEPEKEQT